MGGNSSWTSTQKPQFQKPWSSKSKGKKIPPSLRVWIGSIPEGITWKELQEHMNQGGQTKWVEVFEGKGKGTGMVGYSTAQEVHAAVAMLNGSILGGAQIICDAWEKQPK